MLYTKQHVSNLGRAGFAYPVDEQYTTGNVFAGYSFGVWAVEAGGGPLGQFNSEDISNTFDIKQQITTEHFFVAVLRHFRFGAFSINGRLGVSRVAMKNHEYGFNENGPNQDFQESSAATAPMFGGGAAYAFGRIAVRADLFRINNVARSFHAENSDITTFALGLQYSF